MLPKAAIVVCGLLFAVTAWSGARHAQGETLYLPDYGAAPEIAGIEQWLNAEPLTIASLKGKVVLIDFWTYACVNCVRTLPHVTGWYEKYKDQGFVVIGVHTPEFPFERVTASVRNAIARHRIRYPVALDNRYATWKAYDNQFWPAIYLIDRKGRIRFRHAGEGSYDETARAIRVLLQASKS